VPNAVRTVKSLLNLQPTNKCSAAGVLKPVAATMLLQADMKKEISTDLMKVTATVPAEAHPILSIGTVKCSQRLVTNAANLANFLSGPAITNPYIAVIVSICVAKEAVYTTTQMNVTPKIRVVIPVKRSESLRIRSYPLM
jgi:hypothetical protein